MRIYPFRGLRYNTAKVSLEKVVTQPYDKISPTVQQRYYEASPYNIVRIILGKQTSNDDEAQNAYTRASELLKEWRAEQILKEEAEPALYGYAQRYIVPGTGEVRERRGVICLGHIYDYAEKIVYRHEYTLAKPKSDRLKLLKTTRMSAEQIYMIYSDPSFSIEKLVFGNATGEPETAPDQSITDEYGTMHSLWKITDPHLISLIAGTISDKKLIIADGHHRYEAAMDYARERALDLGLPDPTHRRDPRDAAESPSVHADEGHPVTPQPPFREAAIMMTLVNMEAPGTTILPTNRVVFGLKNFSLPTFLTQLEPYFTVQKLKPSAERDDANEKMTDDRSAELQAPLEASPVTAFVMATPDGEYLLKAKPAEVEFALTHLSERQRELDVVQLHKLVFEKILGLTEESIRNGENLRYLRNASEAVAQVEDGEADLAFLVKPVTLEQLRNVSLAMEVMPQKSTDFYPKLLSGLAFYALD